MNGPLTPVQGTVKSVHTYVTMFVGFDSLVNHIVDSENP